jgi:hypothetical protein
MGKLIKVRTQAINVAAGAKHKPHFLGQDGYMPLRVGKLLSGAVTVLLGLPQRLNHLRHFLRGNCQR